MADDIPTVNLDDTSSDKTDSPSDSNRDSLNSLLQKTKDNNENCVDDCDLGKQCSMICSDSSNESKARSAFCCNSMGQSVWGVILMILSISGFIYFNPTDIMLWEKLNMRPGLPPYVWWSDPPDQVRTRVYVFNITNHDRFLAGLDDKINVKEVGPITYLEKLLHSKIRFNENETMTYEARRFLIYLPEENTIDINTTIIVPNLALLGIASRLHDANYLLRMGFNILVNTHNSQWFVKRSIYEYLWDYRENILETTKNLAPQMVPTTNMGMLHSIYKDFVDNVTVKIGPAWGHHNFFKIDKYGGREQLKGYDIKSCNDRLTGSTEGVLYHQHMKKDDVLYYLRKTVCRTMPLYFDQELTIDNVPAYRYNLSEKAFDRIKNDTDCYDMQPSLPDGLSDTSKCYDGLPLVASYPHFYTSTESDEYVTGLSPDREKHNSFVVVEPLSGTPFRAVARMQCNMRVSNLSDFNLKLYDRFSNLVIPVGWIEYSQEGLPPIIKYTIYFMVVVLPPLSTALICTTLLIGFYLITKQIYRAKKDLFNRNVDRLTNNKVLSFETETFIKVPS
ncbi:lysosome membrane protein 2-like [Zerene cesonia]|uniref:lysosome membrane protein 2-like n=1 Tax=Zerene cesonia TaxID=33412 RepID=UPI0018E4EF50|nr:lysosome membrane protein 2-like [Zerene cesonia]